MVCSLLVAGQTPDVRREVIDLAVALVDTPKSDDLQTALANHPDVQIAEAKLRIAQAELAKVKLAVAQQVTAAQASVSQVRAEAERAERELVRVRKLADAKTASAAELQQAAAMRGQAKANLAKAEAELRTFLGVTTGGQRVLTTDVTFVPNLSAVLGDSIVRYERFTPVSSPPAQVGSAADKLRTALNKPIIFKAALENVTAESALAALKEAGSLDFIIKWGPGDTRNPPPVLSLPAGERSLAAWFDLLADEYDQAAGRSPPLRLTPYVREYGLLVAGTDSKPPGAVSLAEFAKQKSKAEPGVPTGLRDKLRAALAKTVNRAEMTVPPAVFLKELFATTGPELTVQSHLFTDEPITILGGEKTVLAWLEQLQDKWNAGLKPTARCEYFVRDYGLLLCPPADAPAGAVPLSQVK